MVDTDDSRDIPKRARPAAKSRPFAKVVVIELIRSKDFWIWLTAITVPLIKVLATLVTQ
jgi:hypothetical protein